ncbi:hypothetical protein NQ314_012897, partial [Rhamnusium bicolor]
VFDIYGYEMDVHLHMAIILLPILLTALIRNLKYLAPFSTLANVLMITGIIIALYYASQDLPPISERRYVADLEQIPIVFWLAQSVKIIISLGILFTYALQFYIAVDIIWPNVQKFLGQVKYPVLAESAFRAFLVLVTCIVIREDLTKQKLEILKMALGKIGDNGKVWTNNSNIFMKSDVDGVILAEAIPFLGLFISLVGAVSSSALALLFPPILDLVTCYTYGRLSSVVVIKDVFILLIGFVGMLTGGYESINAIAHAFAKTD